MAPEMAPLPSVPTHFGQLGLTYDDVLLLPGETDVVPSEVDTTSRLTREISLRVPLISAAMPAADNSRLSTAMASATVGRVSKASERQTVCPFSTGTRFACALTTVCLAQDHPEPLRLKAAFFMTSAPASTELPQAPPATHKDPAIAPLPSPPRLTLGEVVRRAQQQDVLIYCIGILAAFEIMRFELVALRLEMFAIGFGGTQGLATGQQEIAGIAGLHIHNFAELAELCDAFEQNDFHDRLLWSF